MVVVEHVSLSRPKIKWRIPDMVLRKEIFPPSDEITNSLRVQNKCQTPSQFADAGRFY
jgi:hypothetical protein